MLNILYKFKMYKLCINVVIFTYVVDTTYFIIVTFYLQNVFGDIMYYETHHSSKSFITYLLFLTVNQFLDSKLLR